MGFALHLGVCKTQPTGHVVMAANHAAGPAFIALPFFFSTEAQRRPYYADYSPARKYIHTLCTSHYLDLFITFIIGVNVITMSMEHYNQPKVRAAHQRVGWETAAWGSRGPCAASLGAFPVL